MLSSVLSSAPHHPLLKSHKSFSFGQRPTLKDPILIRGPVFRSLVNGRSRVSEPMIVPELGVDGAFMGHGCGERSRLKRVEAIPGDSSSGFGRRFERKEIESVMNRMSKWIVSALFILVMLWKHDAEALWIVSGSVVNSWICIAMKQLLNHERPVSALRSDPGMPSSHAQSIFFAASYAVPSLVRWLGLSMLSAILGTVILACGSYFSWLRISQQLHTVSQVLVGAALGFMCGIVWFWLWQSFVQEAFISSNQVRIFLVLGSATFSASFLVYVVRDWVIGEQ